MARYILAVGIPVNNEDNQAHARRLGMPPSMPWPPHYANSVQRPCSKCHGATWVGPKLREQIDSAPVALALLCLFCAAVEHNRLQADVTLMALSRDEATEK